MQPRGPTSGRPGALGIICAFSVVLVCLANASAAAAVEGPTTLCVEPELVTCNKQWIAISLEAETKASPTEGTKLVTNLGTVVCDESISGGITGPATSSGALTGEITSIAATSCTIGGTNPCTVTTVNLPYAARIATEGTANKGSLYTKSSGKGNPGMTVVCGEIINCTYTVTEPKYSIEGGVAGVANIKATSISLSKSGAKCTTTGSMSGTYFISTPTPIYISM